MTREEKINTLKTIIQECEEYQWQRKETLFEIIKDLGQEHCEDVSDVNDGKIYKCSCGYGWDKSKVVRHHFCPNCGKPVDDSIIKLKPRGDCISRQYLLDNCVVDKVTMPYVPISKIENAPPVTPCPNNVSDKIRTKMKGLYRVILKGTPKDDWAVRWNDCLDEVNDLLSEIQMNYCEHCGAKTEKVKRDEISE